MKLIININHEPTRGEYYATTDNYDGAPDGNNALGWGYTQSEAVYNLIDLITGYELDRKEKHHDNI